MSPLVVFILVLFLLSVGLLGASVVLFYRRYRAYTKATLAALQTQQDATKN